MENIEKYKKRNVLLDRITEIFIIMIVIVFPLCVDSTGFFKILECKYRVYLYMSVTYISICLLILIYYLIFYKVRTFRYLKFEKIHYAVLAFWGINVISCFISPYFQKYNLFVGVGRGEGLINISLYCFTFLFITLFGVFRKRYITYFSISSICINIIAILQYVGFNPLNMYQDGIGTHNVSFMATIGNIDFISALYCILLSISFVAFVFLDEKIQYKVIHLTSIFMGYFIFIIINVMSGRVGFLATFAILFPFIITNSKRLYRTIIAISMIILGLAINIIINPRYHFDIGRLTLDFQINAIALILIVITIIFWILSYLLYKYEYNLSNNKKIIKFLYFLMIFLIIIAIIVLYFINLKSGILFEVHEILHGNFDDDFGTYRVFLWKRAFSLLKERPIIGSGPDTFAVRFMDKYTEDVIALGELSINDTAGNVYITMLINVGILGLGAYLLLMFLQFKEGLLRGSMYSKVLLTAIICYWIQDFFNLWVVIVVPVFWTLMALYVLSLEKNTKVIEDGGKTNESRN